MVGELWDLRAVVEGCSRSRTMSGSFSSASLPPEEPEKMEYPLFSVKDEAGPQELQEFVKHYVQPSKEQNNNEEKKTLSPAAKSKKKRKNQLKKVVCELPADSLSDNVWAWRKYGQKPIKDSPHPRGYYRCSSLKGCPARKQVERCGTKPGFFVVTYTGQHNHAAPLNRQKSLPLSVLLKSPITSSETSSASAAEQRTPTPMRETEREAEGNVFGDDLNLLSEDDDIFMDLDQLIDSDLEGSAAGFSDDLLDDVGDAWPMRNAGS